jgi:hypothetical protein
MMTFRTVTAAHVPPRFVGTPLIQLRGNRAIRISILSQSFYAFYDGLLMLVLTQRRGQLRFSH